MPRRAEGRHTISMHVGDSTHDAVQQIADRHQVSKTEALTRLVGVGWMFIQAAHNGDDVIIRTKNGDTDRIAFFW
jgi:hypothetical protein